MDWPKNVEAAMSRLEAEISKVIAFEWEQPFVTFGLDNLGPYVWVSVSNHDGPDCPYKRRIKWGDFERGIVRDSEDDNREETKALIRCLERTLNKAKLSYSAQMDKYGARQD